MDHPDYKALLKTLRQALKAKKYTYADLARELSVSEVTVKRVFSGQPCATERLFDICKVLGISFFDLAALAATEQNADYVLSAKQEEFFAKRPGYFAIFKELYKGTSTIAVASAWKLNHHQLHQALRVLEKLDLLEVLPGSQVRFKARGNICWSSGGPLSKKILRPQISSFLDHVERVTSDSDVSFHSSEHEMTQESLEEFVAEVDALSRKYRGRALREKSLLPKSKLRTVRWLFALAPFQTDWHQYTI